MFIDGDDLCAGCGKCCDPVDELRITQEEFDRLPLLQPFAHDFDGIFHTVDVDGPCPYLQDDRRCGTFASRPFDCSLFPAFVEPIRVRSGDNTAIVRWGKGGLQCPHPDLLFDQVSGSNVQHLGEWAQQAAGSDAVELVRVPDQRAPSLLRRAIRGSLGRLGLLGAAKRLRAALRSRPSEGPSERT